MMAKCEDRDVVNDELLVLIIDNISVKTERKKE